MAEGPAQQEGGGNVEASVATGMVNSKRQRRPSVRLGEIGEMPVAVLLDRPLKRRKRRPAAAAAPPVSAALGRVLEDGNVGEAGQDADMEMDPTAVDMTGFNEEDPARIAWERPPRTRPLLHVATTIGTGFLAHKCNDENSEDGLFDNGGGDVHELESAGNHEDKDGDDKQHENINGLLPDLKSSTPKKGKYGRRRRVAASRAAAATWRARKAAAAATAAATAAAGVAKKTKESRNVASSGRVSGDAECNGVLKDDDAEEQKHDRGRGINKASQRRVSKPNNSGDVGANKDEHDLELSGDEEPLQENHLGDSLDSDDDTAADRDHNNETTHLTEEHESFVLPDFVRNWLEDKRLGKYSELFEFHEVDEDVLPLLTMEDLREMGIVAVGARRKLFHAIQGLG